MGRFFAICRCCYEEVGRLGAFSTILGACTAIPSRLHEFTLPLCLTIFVTARINADFNIYHSFTGTSTKTDGQPKGVAFASGSTVLVTHKGLEVHSEGSKQKDIKTDFTPSCLAASKALVAVGGDDNTLHIYSSALSLQKDIPEPSSLITALAFSPRGDSLAVGFSSGKISVYNCNDWSIAISRWSSHTGRVTSISWNSTGTHAVSGGLDTNIFVWSVAKPGSRVNAANAHKDGVNGVAWIDNDSKVVSVGGDAAVKVWKVEGLS